MKILVHIAAFLLATCNILAQQVQANDNFMNNEIWRWSQNGKNEIHSIGRSQMFLFLTDGRFYYSSTFSGGMHRVKWETGNYIFDRENSQIVLSNIQKTKDNYRSYMTDKAASDKTTQARMLPDTIHIDKIDNKTVTCVMPQSTKKDFLRASFSIDAMEDKYFRTTNADVLYPQNWDTEPYIVTAVWVDKLGKRKSVKGANITALLQYINSVQYHNEFNDGRMMKMTTPDYYINICTGMSIFIEVWQNGLIRIGGHWYKPAIGQDFNDFLDILKKYA